MKFSSAPKKFFRSQFAWAAALLSLLPLPPQLALHAQGVASEKDNAPVTIIDSGATVTLANGVVSLEINKQNANILGLRFHGLDIVDVAHQASGSGYWNVYGQIPGGAKTQAKGMPSVVTITQDPARNAGAIGEIELFFPYKGGTDAEPVDIAIRYTLRRGDSGVYGWTSVTHKPGYPPFDIEASTMALKLNPDVFDHLTADSRRNKDMITGYDWMHGDHLNLKEACRMTTGIHNGEVEHKYDYAAIFSETPAFGWSSTKKNVGVWIINPSIEYLNGAPTRIELTGHIDLKDSSPADPTLLFIWHGPHYGGLPIMINAADAWNKVVGPFLIYCDSGPTPDAMWKDALARAANEKRQWPYAWAKMPGYANLEQRGAVAGRLLVKDPQQPNANAANAWVGLAKQSYTGTGEDTKTVNVGWETDGKHYEYWAHADKNGAFTIRNARPGKYVLYAFNDGILGDFSRADVTISEGRTLQLGTLGWTPVRYGRQVWEIGVPNRSAEEFRHGDHYWQWGLYNLYPKEFPNGVDFVVGKSDWKKDWNYAQPPTQGADGRWRGTTWRISFKMAKLPAGTATLRLAICGSRGNSVDVSVNGIPIGATGPLPNSGVMHRDGIRSTETEIDLPFDASLLAGGKNEIELTTHASDWTQGVLYDYLRLELNRSGHHPSSSTPARASSIVKARTYLTHHSVR